MLSGRRTLRRLGQSAAGLAVVTAAGLAERDAKPEIPQRDDGTPGQRDLRVEEIPQRSVRRAARMMPVHLRTIDDVPGDATRPSTPHGELTLEQIAELLPGTGELMQSVGAAWWKCAYAARGGNWALAAYFARRVRGLQRKLAIVRPKYADDIAAFESVQIAAVLTACERADRAIFDTAFADAVDAANELHVKWGKGYIRWTLPTDPPTDLDLKG
jgi:hypothetical protein